ncbi:PREDICTED: protein Shroom2-like, partial [Nanorana parkeri]|uniref:protein Shroom2-like n=1 Tax=Nanorana parkeri TaxID=125878 RepID=UPI000854D458
MENLETRGGRERFVPDDMRTPPGLVDQGHNLMMERKIVEGYKFVDVFLTGGAPWGFTLKGGREHGELLIITKVEEGSKAAETLIAGDEIVNINDIPLSGYRQEAICLVKGSHKTLKMVIKRKNDIAYRPHSWHSTKFIESPMETLTAQLSNSNLNPSWNSQYHSSSSSHDLSSSWDQANLQRSSGHFSSVGSMDSIDQTYQSGKLSSSKSNNSIDYVGNQNKRDSAYGSFSTSFVTPEHSLSKNSSVSSENILYQINEWDNAKPTHGKGGQVSQDLRRVDDKQGYQSPSLSVDSNKQQRTEDNVESRQSGRSNFGPVWHVPDKRKTASSPPPPPPPLRSDSYAVTKSHEKPAPTHSELTSTQHFNVANRSHLRPDWNSEISDYQQRLLRAPDRRISNSSYKSEIHLDQIASYKEKHQNSVPHSGRLQSSQSTSDVRFAQPSYNYHHQRQYSDESTFFQNTRVSPFVNAPPQQVAFSSGSYEVDADQPNVYSAPHTRGPSFSESNNGGRVRGDCNAPSRISSANSKQPPQVTISHHQYNEEYSKSEIPSNTWSTQQDSGALKSGYSLPQQNNQPSPESCDVYSSKVIEKKDIYPSNNERMKPRKVSDSYEGHHSNHNVSQHDLTNKQVSPNKYRPHQDYCWNDQEDSKITPQITPMLHSLTQEGRNRSVSSPDTNEKYIDAAKHSRRSDRFATTLRNEIQQRKARLQKSKSTATLTECNEGDSFESWNQDSPESVTPSSDGAFSSTYKNHLKEAQARVLRATSFRRRDLEPVIVDSSLSPEQRKQGYKVSKPSFHTDVSSYPGEQVQPRHVPVSSSQNVTRIGARKRFTAQQKLKSYSEPEKINEVGICEDNNNFESNASQEAVGSFADKWKFFEETSKSAQPAPKSIPPTFTDEKHETYNVKDYENVPRESWLEKRSRAASLGAENIIDRDKNPTEPQHGASYESFDTAQQPPRLGTFAEYQASWKEQKQPLERKNSGRCHSADNILDAGLDQNERSQYIHERSRSSPTTDFYAQGEIVDSKKQATSERENAEDVHLTHCSSSRGRSSVRIAETEDREYPSVETEDSSSESKHKPTSKSSEISDTANVPQQSRARSGTLPSDYRFVNENVKYRSRDIGYSADPISENQIDVKNFPQTSEGNQWQDAVPVNKKRGPAPQRPPPPKLDKYWRQNGSTSSLATSTESLLTTAQGKGVAPYSPASLDAVKPETTPGHSPGVPSDKHLSVILHKSQPSGSLENVGQHLEKKPVNSESERSPKPCYLQKPGMEPSRSPSPQFAPQKLTDKPPFMVQDENMARIERVIDNTTVKMVPIKIVHSESHAEKESRNNLLSAIEPPALHTAVGKDQLKTLSTSEQSYSRFCAYTRHGSDPEEQSRLMDSQPVLESSENTKEGAISSLPSCNSKNKDLIYADLKSEELVREIVDKDKSLADILDPNTKMMTTMDLMEGIFRKDEHLLEEAQQRRKLHPKVPSPRPPDEKKEDQNTTAATSLTTSSTYYSTSAPKAELLIKMKDMQEQQHTEENSEEELGHNLYEKK